MTYRFVASLVVLSQLFATSVHGRMTSPAIRPESVSLAQLATLTPDEQVELQRVISDSPTYDLGLAQAAGVQMPRRDPLSASNVWAIEQLRVRGLRGDAEARRSQLAQGKLLYSHLDEGPDRRLRSSVQSMLMASESAIPAELDTRVGVWQQLSTDGEVLGLKPYVLAARRLQYDEKTGEFEGTITVGVVSVFNGATRRHSLSHPMSIQVLDAVSAEPHELEIDSTSPPGKSIRVRSRVVGEPVTLSLLSNYWSGAWEVKVPVEPRLLVSVDADRIRAFGMQTAGITVRAVGRTPEPSENVDLRVSNGRLENEGALDFNGGVARATLRSDGLGDIKVSANASGYAPGVYTGIEAVWPVQTLAAALLGGLIGGLTRIAPRIRRSMKVLLLTKHVAVACFVGIIVFAASVIGVNLLPIQISPQAGDIAAFAISAIGAWLGVAVLPKP